MFDHKASALKKLKMKPSMHSHDAIPQVDTPKEEDERGDAAPSLKAHEDGELGPEHLEILAKLISQISHPGRDAMSMDEKAVGGMKDKMASISKHKK